VNIGEFLAIVHALAYLKQRDMSWPVYSDSRTAIAWIRRKKANTKLEQTEKNQKLFLLIRRAEEWLRHNTWPNRILKWETEYWGEIPADFGRK
jgi:ribonuclease HI